MTIDAGAVNMESTAESHKVELDVETVYRESEPLPGGGSTVVADINIMLFVDGDPVHTFESGKKATISTKVLAGMSDVNVVYNGSGEQPFDLCQWQQQKQPGIRDF